MQSYTFHISGTHCSACKILIEDVLSEQSNLQNAQVDLNEQTLSFETESTDQDGLMNTLNDELIPFGYTLSVIS